MSDFSSDACKRYTTLISVDGMEITNREGGGGRKWVGEREREIFRKYKMRSYNLKNIVRLGTFAPLLTTSIAV